ncbi:MAG: Calx-beta domain-containing protein [Chloroflexota bacterium]|nr:Calx-beta domain-containing protein [Chloroflexota bacterium]
MSQRISRILGLVAALGALVFAAFLLSGAPLQAEPQARPLLQSSYTYTITATSASAVTMGDMADTLSFIVTNTGNDTDKPIDYVQLEFDTALYDVSNATSAPSGWSISEIKNAGQGQAYVIYIANSTSDALVPDAAQTFTVAVLGRSSGVFARDTEDKPDTLDTVVVRYETFAAKKNDEQSFTGGLPSWLRRGLAVSVIASPPSVAVGELITVTMVVDNRSTASQSNITRTLTFTPTGMVTLTNGPIPITLTLSSGASEVVTHTYQAATEGVVTFLGSATNITVTSDAVQSNKVVIGDFTALMEAAPTTIVAGQDVTVRLRVYNNSGGTLGNIRPSTPGFVGDASVVSFSGPSPPVVPSLPAGSTTTFEWTYTLTGTVGSTYAFTGTASANGPLATNVAQSNSGAISQYTAYVTPRRVGTATATPLSLAFTVANNGATTIDNFEFTLPTDFTDQASGSTGQTGGSVGVPCTWNYRTNQNDFQPAGACSGLPPGGTAVLTITFESIPAPDVDTNYNFLIDFCSGTGVCSPGSGNTAWQGAVDVPFTITRYRIEVAANPTSLYANGFDTSVITATVYEGITETVAGAAVVFAATGTEGTLSAYGGTTDANGVVTVTFTAPAGSVDSQAAIVAAYLTAEGQVTIDLIGVGGPNPLYVGGTLDPVTVAPGDTVTFTLDVINVGVQPVTLTTSSVFTFTDGAHTFSSALVAGTAIPTDTTRTLTFTQALVDGNFAPGAYFPSLGLTGWITSSAVTQYFPRPISDQIAVAVALQFSSATYSVNEDAGSATITVTLGAASSVTVTVDYATSDGTAVAGSDYTTATGTLTFSPGVTSQTFTVPITDDTEIEGDETVNLVLSNPANALLGSPSSAVLTIVNDDVPVVGVDKAVSPSTVPVAGQLVTHTYIITITNNGVSTIKVQQITDTLPSGFTFITTTAASELPDSVVTSTQSITWSYSAPLPSISSGDIFTLTFMATSNTGGGEFCNSAGVTIWKDTVFAETDLACVIVAWPVYEITAQASSQTIRVRVRMVNGQPVIISWEFLP